MRWIAVKRLRLSRISANTAFPALVAPDVVFKNTDCCIGCSFPLPETRMKMAKYEKIRNKRTGLFRRRDPEKALGAAVSPVDFPGFLRPRLAAWWPRPTRAC